MSREGGDKMVKEYSSQQKRYITSVDGQAHQSAVEIIGEMDKVIKAQERLLSSYRIGKNPPEWVFDTLTKARENGYLE